MNLRTILKLTSVVVSITAIVVGVSYFQPENVNKGKSTKISPEDSFGWKFPVAKFPEAGSTRDAIAYSDIRDPGGIPQGLPVRLKIPSISVDSAIEDAYITSDGRMDVPLGSVNVAWFSLGPYPGRVGSAVIGGHFGIRSGVPFVFYDLDKLKLGDKIYVVDDSDNTLAFVVRSTRSFDRNADATPVFTSDDGLAHLNLITCEGEWNQINDTYPDRLVIFTDAIPPEGAVVVKPRTPVTSTKIAKETPSAALTSIPEVVVSTPDNNKKLSPSPKILIASAKGLYKTPTDSLITTILLVSIVFVAYKIVRRLLVN